MTHPCKTPTAAESNPLPPADPWLTSSEVTAIYKISRATLSEWRAKRIGPAFRQLGRAIHYRQSDVEAFVESRIVKTAS